jgi:putative drug exporter of the RND superfamily
LLADAGFQVVATFSALPHDDPVRQASEAASEAFGPGAATPMIVLTQGNGARLGRLLAAQPGVREVRPPQRGRDGWVKVDAILADPPDQNAAERVVERTRESLSHPAVAPVLVGGPTAEAVDFSARLDSRTPLVVVLTLLLEVAILTVLLRAPVIALKAALTTLLSVTATLGIVTVVFGSSGQIGFFVPVMLFAIVFGLSTDYEVFLLSRVRENYLRGMSNTEESLQEAMVKNARAITLAGLTMAVVFFAFATSSLPSFTQIGFGVGIAIMIDVTLVRGLLVPATVALLGDANWWWPRRKVAPDSVTAPRD